MIIVILAPDATEKKEIEGYGGGRFPLPLVVGGSVVGGAEVGAAGEGV